MRCHKVRCIDDALHLADEWGVAVTFGQPVGRGASDRRRGEYHHAAQRITIRPGMTSKQTLCTLTHELAHAFYGDQTSNSDIEARAWNWAARALVEPKRYAEAESLVGSHPGALAIELDVTVPVITAWQRLHLIPIRDANGIDHNVSKSKVFG